MAKHRSLRTPKLTTAHAILGMAVFSSAFGVHTANAETTTPGVLPETPKIAAMPAPKAAAPVEAKPSMTKVLALAKQQIGTSEDAKGGGTKFQKWYMSSQRAVETVARDGGTKQAYLNAAWCAMFVSWVGEETGARKTVGWDAYTVTHAKWFKNNKRWGTTAKPGSVVFFSWSGSKSIDAVQHVGFVEKDNGNGTITTIEGNTGNGKVEERVRPKSQVVGYGYPDYATS